MTFNQSELKNKVLENHSLKIGNLYFLENMVFSEINEGEHLSAKTAMNHFNIISNFYGDKKSFGYVSNRINKFSIEAIDLPKFCDVLNNLKLFVSISYSHFDKMNVSIEKQFSKIPYHNCKNILDSYNFVTSYLKNKKSLTV